jgi:hypothetical protein
VNHALVVGRVVDIVSVPELGMLLGSKVDGSRGLVGFALLVEINELAVGVNRGMRTLDGFVVLVDREWRLVGFDTIVDRKRSLVGKSGTGDTVLCLGVGHRSTSLHVGSGLSGPFAIAKALLLGRYKVSGKSLSSFSSIDLFLGRWSDGRRRRNVRRRGWLLLSRWDPGNSG